MHRAVLLGLEFCVIKVHIHNQIQRADFFVGHVVLGYSNIGLAHLRSLERRQTHVVLGRIRTGCNDLRSRMAGSRIFQLVLDGFEEHLCCLALAVIVHGQGKDFLHLLIQPLFAGPDVTDALKQFIKVIRSKLLRITQPLVIQGKALLQILRQDSAGPSAEMNAHIAAHTVADCKDHIKVIVVALSCNFSVAFRLNCSEFPNSCRLLQFSILVDVSDMLTDRGFGNLIQLGHALLGHPDCLVFKIDVNLGITFFILINQNLAGVFNLVTHKPSSSRYFAICACTCSSSASMLAIFCFTSSISTSSSSSKVST